MVTLTAIKNWNNLIDLLSQQDIFAVIIESFTNVSVFVKRVDAPQKLVPSPTTVFNDSDDVHSFITFLAQQADMDFGEHQPIVNIIADDGFQVSAATQPVCPDGTMITITRNLPRDDISLDDLVETNYPPFDVVQFLKAAIISTANIAIVGSDPTARTVVLRALAEYIHPEDRVLTLQPRYATWKPPQRWHLGVTFPAHPIPDKDYSLIQTVNGVLDLASDRMLIDGLTDSSALLSILTTVSGGIKGLIISLSVETPATLISQLEMLPSLSGSDIPPRTIRNHIYSALDIIVQVERSAVGQLEIKRIAQIDTTSTGLTATDLFVRRDVDTSCKPTGVQPHVYEMMLAFGVALSPALFGLSVSEMFDITAPQFNADDRNLPYPQQIWTRAKRLLESKDARIKRLERRVAEQMNFIYWSISSSQIRDQGERKPETDAKIVNLELRHKIEEEIASRVDLIDESRTKDIKDVDVQALRQELIEAFNSVMAELSIVLGKSDRLRLFEQVTANLIGFGPLEPLLSNDSVTDIEVIGPDLILTEERGRLVEQAFGFDDDRHLDQIIERMQDQRSYEPFAPMQFPDGSLLRVAQPPLVSATYLQIRKFGKDSLTVQDFVRWGIASPNVFEFIRACVIANMNLVICGGDGSGRTTLLDICSSFIPNDERIITVEHLAVLQLQQEHVLTLQSARTEMSLGELFREAINLRPHRIATTDLRGSEALDVINIMNFEDISVMLSMVGNDPVDVLARLESMALLAELDLTVEQVRKRLATGVDFVIHQERLRDASRKIMTISEVRGLVDGDISLTPIFEFEETGVEGGKIIGRVRPTGEIPYRLADIVRTGKYFGPEFWGYDPTTSRTRKVGKRVYPGMKEYKEKLDEVLKHANMSIDRFERLVAFYEARERYTHRRTR